MIQAILTAFLSAVLIENFVLVRFLGICPFLGVSKKINTPMPKAVFIFFDTPRNGHIPKNLTSTKF